LQHQIAVQSLKKLSNPRLKPETRRKLIQDVITDEKLSYDLANYPCFEKFPRRDKVLVIKHMKEYYLYHAMNNTYFRGGNIKTVKLMLLFMAKEQTKFMTFKYIISNVGVINTILDNKELKDLFFKLIIKYNVRQAISFLFLPEYQYIMPDKYKDKLLALYVANQLTK